MKISLHLHWLTQKLLFNEMIALTKMVRINKVLVRIQEEVGKPPRVMTNIWTKGLCWTIMHAYPRPKEELIFVEINETEGITVNLNHPFALCLT